MVLPIDTVDEQLCVVISYTNHFTDFINGILKVPDAPQTSAFTPTSLSGMKAANPLEGMNMMSPPSANNSGTANLSLPIDIPAGRHGMQPSLGLSYSSEGGNGWLGVGWNMSVPSIDVETRWGVPRYSSRLETESYLISGSQLTPLVQRESFKLRKNYMKTKQFYHRVKGSYDKIMRYGNSPSSYYWVVTDRNGTKYYYGTYSSSGVEDSLLSVNSALILSGGTSNNIAHWALAEVRDLNGNYVKYEYQTKVHNGGISGASSGKEIYPLKITYTGHGTTQGKYTVDFMLDNGSQRSDVMISARNGFKEVTAHLLDSIRVSYDGDFYRKYKMLYKNGAFDKTVLCSVVEIVDKASLYLVDTIKCGDVGDFPTAYEGLRVHRFEYFEQDESGFSDAVTLTTTLDESPSTWLGVPLGSNTITLGQTYSKGTSIGGSLNVGVGSSFWNKTTSGGGSYGYSDNISRPLLVFMDIDGDGLPDRVVEDGGKIKYRKLNYTGSGLAFSSSLIELIGLDKLGKTNSYGYTLGLEAQLVGFGASYSHTKSTNVTSSYFSDVNGDGYVDFIDDGYVYFNEPTTDGVPRFVKETGDIYYFGGDSCKFIIRDTEVNDSVSSYNPGDQDEYGRNAVRVWTAPYDGNIVVNAPIQLIKSNSYGRKQSKYVDGVVYSVQHNHIQYTPDTIYEDDYTIHNTTNRLLHVIRGDRLYFRLESIINRNWDDVKWNPTIYYSDGKVDSTTLDANAKRTYFFRPSDDLLINSKQLFQAPYDGDIRIRGTINSIEQSDTIHFALVHESDTLLPTSFADNTIINHYIDTLIQVQQGDSLLLFANTNTSINYNNFHYDIKMYYTSIDTSLYHVSIDTNSTYSITSVRPVIQFNLYQTCLKQTSLSSVQNLGNHTFFPKVVFNNNSLANGTLVLSIKSTSNQVLGKSSFQVSQGVLTGDSIVINLQNLNGLYYEFFSEDNSFADNIANSKVRVVYKKDSVDYSSGFHVFMPDSMWKFGNLYRGWGQFSYKGNGPINEPDLYLAGIYKDTNLLALSVSGINNPSAMKTAFDNSKMNNPVKEPFNMMFVDMDSLVWRDFAHHSSVSGRQMSNSMATLNSSSDLSPDSYWIQKTNQNQKVKCIRQVSEQINNAFGVLLGASVVSGGGSYVKGNSRSLISYFDMNGDRYPDIVDKENIQYSTPQGGLTPTINKGVINGLSYDGFDAFGGSFGVELLKVKTENDKYTIKVNSGISGTINNDNSDYSYSDINGDGLPDKISETGKVHLNYGYSIGGEENWQFTDISKGSSKGLGVSLGGSFTTSQFSWALGISSNWSKNEKTYLIMDMNADGLADLVSHDNSKVYVYFNKGNGFASSQIWDGDKYLNKSKSQNADASISGTMGIAAFGLKTTINLRLGATASYTRENSRLMDIDNDGFPDIVTVDGTTDIIVQYSKLGKLNKLKKVSTPTEASITIDYEITQSDQKMPNRKWVMNSVKVFDNHTSDGVDTIAYAFEYKNGYYDRFERTFYGFDTVKTKQINNTSSIKYAYRTTQETYFNDDFYYQGKKVSEAIYDSTNTKYMETQYGYTNSDCYGPIGYEFPALLAVDKYFYEGQSSAQMHTRQEFSYDQYANVTRFIDKRDIQSADSIRSEITYQVAKSNNILSLPVSVTVKQGANTFRTRTATYDTTNGSLSTMSIDNNGNASTYSFTYDTYGNMTQITAPENSNGQHVNYSYVYDNTVHAYPTSVSDVFGNTSTTDYDLRIGKPTQTVDITNNEMKYTYYNDGRLKTVLGPNEDSLGAPYSIKFEYYNVLHGSTDAPWARTSYYDAINSTSSTINTFTNVIITDALGRVVQTKKKARVFNYNLNTDSYEMLVSGKTILDPYGRAIYSYQPTTDPGFDYIETAYTDTIQPTRIYYDVLDRKTKIRTPDNKNTSMSYSFGNDAFNKKQFKQTTVSADSVSYSTYINSIGKQTTIEAPYSVTTKFEYDPLGQLLKSTDPEDNQTQYSYDQLGQLTQRIHPDAGTTNYTYDKAGNLLTVQTANLINQSASISYMYDYNRLIEVNYPNNPENNVFYEYGGIDPNTGSNNQTGRLVKLQDASGVQSFKYGKMGELKENIHTFVMPHGQTYSFAMQWTYDSWNRTQDITYADGEKVMYQYDNAGQLYSMYSEKGQTTQDIINSISYDKFGSRARIEYGNNTRSEYTYEPLFHRLSNLKTFDANSQNPIQDIDYNYTTAGNLSKIENSATAVSGLGGEYTYTYNYDSLYRLMSSTGTFEDGNANNYAFNLGMQYSASGNILNKTLTANTLIAGTNSSVSYNRSYNYNILQPHTVNNINDTLSMEWDANGNMIQFIDMDNALTRNLCWDEENRLTTVRDERNLSSYIYNAGGERVWKITGEVNRMYLNGSNYVDNADLNNKTLYTSPYMVVSDREYTKHYYAGSQRVLTKIGGGMTNNIIDPFTYQEGLADSYEGDYNQKASELGEMMERGFVCSGIEANNVGMDPVLNSVEEGVNRNDPEDIQFFYHSDHLGSSSWITDNVGDVNQHLQYLPFGESFIDQRTNHDIRYKFTTKEEDSETGYQYFGARYYASDLSIWLSVDPLADQYPSTSPFMYVLGNPIIFVDPNGMNHDYYEHTDENGNSSVIYRDGHAATVTKDGQTYENIGSTYSRDNGDGTNSHYVQNEYLGTSEGSIGELLQHDGYANRAFDIAQKHSYETEIDVYMKAFDFGYAKSSQYAIAGTLSIPVAVIAAAELAPLAYSGAVWYEYNTGVLGAVIMGAEYFGYWMQHTVGGEIVSTFVVATAPPSAVVALRSKQILEQSVKFGMELYKNTSIPSTKMSIDEVNKEMKSNWQINSGTGPE